MKLNPLILVAAGMLLAVAIALFVLEQPTPGGIALGAAVALLVPSTTLKEG